MFIILFKNTCLLNHLVVSLNFIFLQLTNIKIYHTDRLAYCLGSLETRKISRQTSHIKEV